MPVVLWSSKKVEDKVASTKYKVLSVKKCKDKKEFEDKSTKFKKS